MSEIKIRDITKIILKIFTILTLVFVGIIIVPESNGDGPEYMLMTEAFQNHFTPNILESDINSSVESYGITINKNEISGLPGGFFKAKNNNVYSYHFWVYSLMVVPIKFLLKIINANQFRCFQIFNALLYIITLWYTYKRLKLSDINKFFIIMLLMINPALFYIIWPHPEIFTYSFVCMSLVMYINKEYEKAILFVSIAGMQNQPVIFLGGMYLIQYIIEAYFKKDDFKLKRMIIDIIKKCMFYIPFFIPLIFYYLNFGTFSLIASSGYVKNIDILKKINSLYFDLNQGMILFMPIIVIVFFILILMGIIKRNINTFINFITISIIMAVCSLQINWNPGESGLMRYNVWITPIIIYYIIINKKYIDNIKLKNYINKFIGYSIVFTGIIIICTGGFKYKYTYLEFNPVAKYLLNNYPALYNPQYEIFAERALNKEVEYNDKLPIIYKSPNGYVKKILMDNNSIEKLLNQVDLGKDIVNKKLDKYKDSPNMYYLSFQNDIVSLKDTKISEENRKFEITLLNNISKLEKDKEYNFEVIIKNLGNQVWKKCNYNEDNPIGVSYHWMDESNNMVIFDGFRTYLQDDIYPGENKNINLNLRTPDESGKYRLVLDIVQERISWFSDFNNNSYVYEIEIR